MSRKTTDLEQVKLIANSLVDLPVERDKKFPDLIVHHPFIDSPYLYTRSFEMFSIDDEDKLNEYRELLRTFINDAKSLSGFIMMVCRPYRVNFIRLVADKLSDEDLAKWLKIAWMTQEFPNHTENECLEETMNLFKRVKHHLMDDEDKHVYDSLPEVITVYRGQSYDGPYYNAMSWTLKKSKAEWFRVRFNQAGKLFKAKINKQDILMYSNNMKEDEVIVDFTKLYDLEEISFD